MTKPAEWFPRRGEVYIADMDKPRPVVVVSSDSLNSFSYDVCVVPMTRVRRQVYSIRPRIPAGQGGLRTESWAKCDQVTTLERIDLHYPAVGTLSAESMGAIAEKIRTALELD
jgi:mRNA-degrading endonuclease toxin of MazEF toxin-antitoxin module